MKHILVYTDGACSGNPGPGGWGAVLIYGGHRRELSGGEPDTTNNRMELTGVISALGILKEPCEIDLYTDSQYIVNAINKKWLDNWVKRDFMRPAAAGGPVKNPDLWKKIIALTSYHKVTFHWVKGHAENPYNNRCDELAVAARNKYN